MCISVDEETYQWRVHRLRESLCLFRNFFLLIPPESCELIILRANQDWYRGLRNKGEELYQTLCRDSAVSVVPTDLVESPGLSVPLSYAIQR